MEVRRQGLVRKDRRQHDGPEVIGRFTLCEGGRASRRPAGRRMTISPLSPVGAGIGLRSPHVAQVLAERPAVPWLEVHSENYYVDGGPALAALTRIRADYPLSLHGVGMSLGGSDPLDRAHLAKLARLAERVAPTLVSEHLCWSSVDGRHVND